MRLFPGFCLFIRDVVFLTKCGVINVEFNQLFVIDVFKSKSMRLPFVRGLNILLDLLVRPMSAIRRCSSNSETTDKFNLAFVLTPEVFDFLLKAFLLSIDD